MPTIEQIRFVFEIAQTGSISQAARNLYTSQPYLSTTLKEVEQELQVSLFDRNNKGVSLTKQGELFVRYAEELLASLEKIKALQHLSPAQNDVSLSVVGANEIILYDVFSRFSEMHKEKKWRLSYIEHSDNNGHELLLNHQADLVVQLIEVKYAKQKDAFYSSQGLVFYPLYRDEVSVMVGEHHPLYRRESVRMAELAPYPFVVPQDMAHPERFLSNKQLKIDPVSLKNGFNMMYHISRTHSYTLSVPVLNAGNPLVQTRRIKHLKIEDYQHETQLGYLLRASQQMNKPLRMYIDFLTNFFAAFNFEAHLEEQAKILRDGAGRRAEKKERDE